MRVKLALAIAVTTALGLGVGVVPSAADHGLPHVAPVARGTFTDDVAAKFNVKLDGRRTQVINLKDSSDLVVVQITIHDGARAAWHTHWGPGLLVNMGPGTLTTLFGDDCALRNYPPGTAFVDPGQGTLHAAFNDSGDDLVLYATFLGVKDAPISADPPADCDPFP